MKKSLKTNKLNDQLLRRFAKARENLERIEIELARFSKNEEEKTLNTTGKWKKASLLQLPNSRLHREHR